MTPDRRALRTLAVTGAQPVRAGRRLVPRPRADRVAAARRRVGARPAVAARRRRGAARRLRRRPQPARRVAAPPPRRRRPAGHHRPAAGGRPGRRRRAVGEPDRHPHPVAAAPAALRHPARGVAVHLDRPAADDLGCGCPAPSRPARSRPPSAAAWPGAACTTDAGRRRRSRCDVAGRGRRAPAAAARRTWLPLRTDHDTDPLRALMAAGAAAARPASTPACRSWPARPPPAGSARAAARRRPAARRQDRRRRRIDPGRAAAVAARAVPARPAADRPRGATAGRRGATRRVERDVRAILDKTAAPAVEIAHPLRRRRRTTARGGDPQPRAGCAGIADAARRRRSPSTPAATGSPTGRGCPTRSHVLAGRRLGAGFLASTPELAVLAALPHDLAVPGPGPGPGQSRCPPRSPSRPAAAASRSSATPRSAATPSACPSPTPASTCTWSARPAPASPPCCST